MDKPYNLTLCMIVKNEADNIKGTLENVVKTLILIIGLFQILVLLITLLIS